MDKLTSYELAEWEAYDKIDPIGTWRDDFRSAKLESLMINIVNQLYAEKNKKPIVTTALDFMPDFAGDGRYEKKEDTNKATTPEEILSLFKGIAARQKQTGKKVNKPMIKKTKP